MVAMRVLRGRRWVQHESLGVGCGVWGFISIDNLGFFDTDTDTDTSTSTSTWKKNNVYRFWILRVKCGFHCQCNWLRFVQRNNFFLKNLKILKLKLGSGCDKKTKCCTCSTCVGEFCTCKSCGAMKSISK